MKFDMGGSATVFGAAKALGFFLHNSSVQHCSASVPDYNHADCLPISADAFCFLLMPAGRITLMHVAT
jgi:hypothetical protein